MKIAEVLLEIADIALPDGYGVGRKDGFVYFVPGAVPGDRVGVRITREGKRFSYGEIAHTDRPSPDRVSAPCPHFDLCGGCALQHLSYEKQLEVKERHLLQTLSRIGGIDTASISVEPIVPSPDRYFSRNKIELAFYDNDKGTALGFREKTAPEAGREGGVVPIDNCLAFSNVVKRILPLVLDYINRHRLSCYNPATGKGLVRRLVLRESKSTGGVMVILETTRGLLPDTEGLWRSLSREVPEVKSLWRGINNRRADAGPYESEEHLSGERYIVETVGNLTFRIYPQSFFQPNTKIAEALYKTVIEFAEPAPRDTILGLYCGMGPMEMLLSRRAGKVTGVDANPENILRARENAKINGIENCVFVEGRVERIEGRLSRAPSVLVIDPPRGGISAEGRNLIAHLKPMKFIYVSCNPSTLARDIKDMRKYGYMLRKIASFDAFPQTGHLEAVALIERQRAL